MNILTIVYHGNVNNFDIKCIKMDNVYSKRGILVQSNKIVIYIIIIVIYILLLMMATMYPNRHLEVVYVDWLPTNFKHAVKSKKNPQHCSEHIANAL